MYDSERQKEREDERKMRRQGENIVERSAKEEEKQKRVF